MGSPPEPRFGHSAVILRRMIIIFAGRNQKEIFNDLNLYDIDRKTWIKPKVEGLIPNPRYYHGATIYEEQKEMWVLGGKVGKFKYFSYKIGKTLVFIFFPLKIKLKETVKGNEKT